MKMKPILGLLGVVLLFPLASCSSAAQIDYSDVNHWLIRSDNPTYDYDCFYLLPTCWTPGVDNPLYAEIDDPTLRSGGQRQYEMQAKILENQCNMYAPLYREINATRCLNMSLSEQKESSQLGYNDCVNAFEYYMKNFNNGRPFILVGHSQGANMIQYMLEDYFCNHLDTLAQMIAAYPLGYSYSQSFFENLDYISFAEKEDDTGVVISWNCEKLKDDGSFGSSNLVCHGGALAMNPITWTNDGEYVDFNDERYLGTPLMEEANFSFQTTYDYARKYEVLIVGGEVDNYLCEGIGETSLHGYDWGFFLNNIKENVAVRAKAFMSI